MSMNRRTLAWLILLAAPASLAIAVWNGSVDIPAARLLAALSGGGDSIDREIVWGLRAPRALAAFACGALLALAGTLLQALLRNLLADPFLLGVSGGAAAGALTAMLIGAGLALQHLFAFAGAAFATASVFAFSLRPSGWNAYRVILAGVALSAGFGAIVSLLLALAPAAQVHGMLFWLLGDLSGATDPLPAWLVLGVAAVMAQSQAAPLDLLALGEDKARSLGVPVMAVQSITFGCAALAAMAAVLLGGSIGFVGLVTPHLLRLMGVHDHRMLLPLSLAAGGGLLALADAVARSVPAPVELPVGIVTAMFGVPALLFLLTRGRADARRAQPVDRRGGQNARGRSGAGGKFRRVLGCTRLQRLGQIEPAARHGGIATALRGLGRAAGTPDRCLAPARAGAATRHPAPGRACRLLGQHAGLRTARPLSAQPTAYSEDPAAKGEALALLDELDLAGHAPQPYRTLSGGERQRARLAQVFMQDPECLLLDEPLQHLDLKHQLGVMQALARRAAGGRAVLMALHEPAMAARICDRAVLLYDSGRVRRGRIAEMLTQDNLELLYQCRLEPAGGPEARIFVPR